MLKYLKIFLNIKIKGFFLRRSLLGIAFILMVSLPSAAKTVRVGYFKDSGNFMSGKDYKSRRFGYAYEYMQTISSYTGWDYEYVYGEWDELYAALCSGEIDVLPDVTKTPEREKQVLFPDFVMGQESYYVYSSKDENGKTLDISPGDYSTWKGKTIGIRKDCYHYDVFMDWQKNKNLGLNYVFFLTSDPYESRFNNHEFDLMLEIDMVANPMWNPVEKIGASDFYLAVSKGRKDILDELNFAFGEIFAMNPSYNSNLWLTYFSDVAVSKTLTPRERRWLDENPVIKVGCFDDYLPFTNKKNEEGKPEGIVVDVFNSVPAAFGLDDIKFEYHFYDDFQTILDDLSAGVLHVAAPVLRCLDWAEERGFSFSVAYASFPMGYVYQEGKYKPGGIVATTKGMASRTFIEENYPCSEIVEYETFEECFDAILDGRVDAAVFNIYKIRGLLNKNKKYKKLTYLVLSNACDRACLVSKQNTALTSILNKFYMTNGRSQIDDVTEYYAVKEQSYSRRNFFKEYLVVLIIAVVSFIVVFFALVLSLRRIKYDIEHDTLTKLYNRRKLDATINKAMKRAEQKHEGFGLLLFDLDDFKVLNDTYGHAVGDLVLKSIATVLKEEVGHDDVAFRWGGEEFMVVCKGSAEEIHELAKHLRKSVEESWLYMNGKVIKFTTTIGVSIYAEGKTYLELFKAADDNLYKGKLSGKNKVVI